MVNGIEPAAKPVLEQAEEVDDVLHEAVCANVWHTMNRILELTSAVTAAVQREKLLLKGDFYSPGTNAATLLEEKG